MPLHLEKASYTSEDGRHSHLEKDSQQRFTEYSVLQREIQAAYDPVEINQLNYTNLREL